MKAEVLNFSIILPLYNMVTLNPSICLSVWIVNSLQVSGVGTSYCLVHLITP